MAEKNNNTQQKNVELAAESKDNKAVDQPTDQLESIADQEVTDQDPVPSEPETAVDEEEQKKRKKNLLLRNYPIASALRRLLLLMKIILR